MPRHEPSERILPQSTEAEQAVLGAMLIERNAIEVALDMLEQDDFLRDAHRTLFRGICDLYRRHDPVDLITIGEWLRTRGHGDTPGTPDDNLLIHCGGMVYLTTLMERTPTAAGIRQYASIVREKSVQRRLIAVADEITRSAYDALDVDTVLSHAEAKVRAVGERLTGTHGADLLPLWEWENRVVQRLRDEDETGEQSGVRLGIPGMDSLVDPLMPGDFMLVAGRPSMGKSVLAMQAGMCMAEQGHGVLMVSLEMEGEAYAKRALSYHDRVDPWQMRTLSYRRAHPDDVYGAVSNAVTDHRNFPLYVTRPKTLCPADLFQLGQYAKRTYDVKAIIVDYLQLMRPDDSRITDPYQRITLISTALKECASSLKVPVIAVSQLSRSVEHRTMKRPMMSDLRESGKLEEDADVILLVYRPGYYQQDDWAENTRNGLDAGDERSTEIICAKQRNGATGAAWMILHKEKTRFYPSTRRSGGE